MDAMLKFNNKYDIDVNLFAELGNNFKASRGNLVSWFENQDKMRCVTANNEHNPSTSSYQQGGTGIMVQYPMTQYARTSSQDSKKLGRY
jgi:hypothetical protein